MLKSEREEERLIWSIDFELYLPVQTCPIAMTIVQMIPHATRLRRRTYDASEQRDEEEDLPRPKSFSQIDSYTCRQPRDMKSTDDELTTRPTRH
jgi:hypothetical protein